MEKIDLNFIFKHIRTADERNELIELIEELIENNFRRDQEPLPGSPFSKNATDAIYVQMNSLGISNSREDIEKFLEKILEGVKKLPELRISIAISPTENLKKNLKDWANNNDMSNVIFNIEVKSEIVAGAIIMSPEGEYGNYSLSSQLDKYFVEQRQEVLQLL